MKQLLTPIKAVIFDVYGTLLEVGPPVPDADAWWSRIFREILGIEPPIDRHEFFAACKRITEEMEQAVRRKGILHPEVNWPVVVQKAIPRLAMFQPDVLKHFATELIRLQHTSWVRPETAYVLGNLHQKGYVLGIASNSQAYTLHELRTGLAPYGLSLEIFEPTLCFFSYEYGFKKPDPYVFRIISVRLEARGINPYETVMVGDQIEKDILPARDVGWQTWLLCGGSEEIQAGDWPRFTKWLGL